MIKKIYDKDRPKVLTDKQEIKKLKKEIAELRAELEEKNMIKKKNKSLNERK